MGIGASGCQKLVLPVELSLDEDEEDDALLEEDVLVDASELDDDPLDDEVASTSPLSRGSSAQALASTASSNVTRTASCRCR